VKQAFRLSCAVALLVFFIGASATVSAQTTPDSFVTQITTSPRDSFAGDISGNGRFVVIESTGDIATLKPGETAATKSPNNADGNREIFLLDYAQRRIFQITNTTSARVDTTKPAIDFTSATSSVDFSNVRVEVSNNAPVLSNNGRWIAFSSNASTPSNFDGDANSAALIADGNQEIFLYFIPAAPAVTLSNGADPAYVDLTTGTFTQITNTAASRVPRAGSATFSPFVAFDNREVSVNDNASVVAFVSVKNLVGNGNTDGSPEVFIYRRTPTEAITQMTSTDNTAFEFTTNPSVSGSGSVVAFLSNANISIGGASNNADKNGEVYLGSYDATTAAAAVTRQVTRTTNLNGSSGANFFFPGRRLSRDGNLIAFESKADLSGTATSSGNSANQDTSTVFIYNAAANSFTQVGPRAANTSAPRFPTFTDYNASLQPATVIFATGLSFTASGTIPTTAADGLNPGGGTQIFSAPVAAPTTFTKLTNTPDLPPGVTAGPSIQPFTSDTRGRMAFSMSTTELGGLNTDGFPEAFYLLSRQGTDVAGATVSFVTGATRRPVTASPTAPAVAGLAPGMLAELSSTTALAPSTQTADSSSESMHRPSLPIELNGVSVSINNAAAGLFRVSPGTIQFVVPLGLAATTGTNTYPVVINNNGTTIRTTIQILPAQPDIFTDDDAFGTNRAVVTNVTNPLLAVGTPEPFTVTTTYVNSSGQSVTEPTKLRIFLTGVRRITDPTQVTVRIGTTDIVGTATAATSPIAISPTDFPGADQITVTLPASLAGAGDVPVIVTITISGQTFTSRPADTAPRIRIN
jgi:uncharacterized protein (TIGR03437 family)